ncbi:beta-L-arabinofuranosidase domain-containing protein [Actinomadura keratinilytica]
MARTCAYLKFIDADRLLHTFRLNVGLPSSAEPCGGWEAPDVQLRGHSTGHLLSALAQAHAATGDDAYAAKARTSWTRKGGRITLTVTVPPSSTAEVHVPGGPTRTVGSGTWTFHGTVS